MLRTSSEALAFFATGEADVILLDLGLPDGDGLDLLAELRQCGVQAPVLIVSQFFEEAQVVRGVALGARYLFKRCVGDEIADFLFGRRLAVLGTTPAQVLRFSLRYRLTKQETRVVAAACVTRKRRGIARLVRCSEETVHDHVKAILEKTGADDLEMVVDWVRREPQSCPPVEDETRRDETRRDETRRDETRRDEQVTRQVAMSRAGRGAITDASLLRREDHQIVARTRTKPGSNGSPRVSGASSLSTGWPGR